MLALDLAIIISPTLTVVVVVIIPKTLQAL